MSQQQSYSYHRKEPFHGNLLVAVATINTWRNKYLTSVEYHKIKEQK